MARWSVVVVTTCSMALYAEASDCVEVYGYKITYRPNALVQEVELFMDGVRTIPEMMSEQEQGCTINQPAPCDHGGGRLPWDGYSSRGSVCWNTVSHSILCDHVITSDTLDVTLPQSGMEAAGGFDVEALDAGGTVLAMQYTIDSNSVLGKITVPLCTQPITTTTSTTSTTTTNTTTTSNSTTTTVTTTTTTTKVVKNCSVDDNCRYCRDGAIVVEDSQDTQKLVYGGGHCVLNSNDVCVDIYTHSPCRGDASACPSDALYEVKPEYLQPAWYQTCSDMKRNYVMGPAGCKGGVDSIGTCTSQYGITEAQDE